MATSTTFQFLNTFTDHTIQDEALTPSEALTWFIVFRHTNWKTGTATISVSRIAQATGLSERYIKQNIKHLRDKRLLLAKRKIGAVSTYALCATPGNPHPKITAKVQPRNKQKQPKSEL